MMLRHKYNEKVKTGHGIVDSYLLRKREDADWGNGAPV